MTQPSRTTETINRDNKAIRDIMHQARELTVPDRATLTLGLIGHLATMMNRSQMAKLMEQLREEVARVQDVPPSRQAEESTDTAGHAAADRGASAGRANDGDAANRSASDRDPTGVRAAGRGAAGDAEDTLHSGDDREARVAAGARPADHESTRPHGDVLREQVRRGAESGERESRETMAGSRASRDGAAREGVGQAGRGEFRSGRLL